MNTSVLYGIVHGNNEIWNNCLTKDFLALFMKNWLSFVSLAHDRHVNIEIKLENLKPQSLVTSVALCVHF